METTKPFLYLDLSKSWREDFHPRDKFGKFSTVKGGSRVVTKTGKTGVVQESGTTHHKVRFDDGKLGKVAKENVIHENDHKKVTKAQKAEKAKAKRDESKATKTKATKEHNKTNATGKTGASKLIIDPTKVSKRASEVQKIKGKTSKQVENARAKNANKKASEARKSQKQSKRQRDMEAPILKRNTAHDESNTVQEVNVRIPQKPLDNPANDKQNQAIADYKGMENSSEEATTIDSMWGDGRAQKILAKPIDKRSEKEIRKLAGEITQANDKLARSVVLKMGSARGLQLASQVNRIGNKATRPENVKVQETNHYGDMLQSARSTMYETMHNILAGSQNPGEGTAVGAHVIRRMKDKLHRDMYALMNDVPAPHDIRQAIGDKSRSESTLSQKLGRTPTHDEVAQHLQENSKAFRDSAIMKPPTWDEKTNDWVATKDRVTEPSERLQALKNYASQQKATSLDKNVGTEGENEVSTASNLTDRNASTVEEQYEKKERQRELADALPKAMKEMGLSDEAIHVMRVKHSQPSETGTKPSLTDTEVAEHINGMGGYKSKPVDQKWVSNRRAEAERKIKQAVTDNHPAIKQLRMMKSFVFSLIVKSIYEFDLIKSLQAWGVDHTVLEQKVVRTQVSSDTFELRKSLLPHEYVGSYVVTDEGEVIARIVEFVLPERNELYKSFNMFMTDIQKSMFPHKGGSNHAINQKASEYVKANAGKYKALANSQQQSVQGKTGGLTWSQQLLKDNPGTCWITWGGKKILIHGSTGEIKYDSRNDAHREEHNQGAQEDKIDFHHEKEALDEHEKTREDATHEAWKAHIADKEAKATKGNGNTVNYDKEREDFAKKNRGASFDKEGKPQFDRDTEVGEHNAHVIDHGINAFKNQMEDMKNRWNDQKNSMKDDTEHKYTNHFASMSEEDREAYEKMSKEDRIKATGEHILNQEGVKERLQKFHDDHKKAGTEAEKRELAQQTLEDLKKMTHGSMALVNAGKMVGKDFNKGSFAGILSDVAKMNPSHAGNLEDLAQRIGTSELSRGRDEVTKNHIPEGKFLIGNPLTGKTMAIQIGSGFEGGRAGKGGKFAPKLAEAFDPEGGNHEDSEMSWGQLGKLLGYSGEDAQKLKENLVSKANTDPTAPFMKPISDEEYNKQRANTKVGLQETMLHKDFKLVNQERDKNGNLASQTFAQKMPDGTMNHVTVDGQGYINDPLMARLLNQRNPVHTADDLNKLLKGAVGNRRWVTAHFGSDIHVGDALGHHVQLEYDGKGAPRVVGGTYDGYRYIDKADVPKGAIDPTSGEPVKALFKNGKLVDRRFTTVNDVAMKQGNAVMYPVGDKFRKGRIHAIEGDNFKVTDGHGHVIGMFKKSDLKPAKEEGRALSNSGQAVARMAQTGVHRMNVSEAFKSDDPKEQKKLNQAKSLFEQALQKAKINQGAFDKDGKLHDEVELSDPMMKKLQKVLGRSKAGKEMLKKFNSAFKQELEIHVPENLREAVGHTGVTVKADGTAKVSASKFEELRDTLGGLSIDHTAQKYLEDHFSRKDRKPKSPEELRAKYQPSNVKNDAFGTHYKAQFKGTSYLMNPQQGLYGTQLEGVSHLVERGRGIAGHGMGTGKTILGVVAALHNKADKLAKGEKPKKTLIVAPKGIMSDWGKEIGSHTNSKALYIGSGMTKTGADGAKMTGDNGRNLWGQEGTEQEATTFKSFKKNAAQHASEDHDFHIVNYDTFMKNRDHFANSGMYDNIAIDEVHAFKNQKGRRGTALAETTDRFNNVWGLSGTPMENDAREVHSLIDTITGGRHELGSQKEFQDKFMKKDKNGKIVGVKPEASEKLGDILANVVQFRGGEDVTYNDGSKISFPHLVGQVSSNPETNPNPKTDFIGDLVDRSRDHQTNDYYGTKHSVTDYEAGTKMVTNPKNGESYEVQTFVPKNLDSASHNMYDKYGELQQKYLPESKLNELATASATGYDQGKKDGSNYLTAMQKLQKYLNAPLSHKMYVGGGDALDSGATDVQSAVKGKKASEGLKEGEHYTVDHDGFKRYFESDGQGGYLKNPDGSPRLLPPLHKNNPKAQYLQDRVHTYLDGLQKENQERVKRGEKPLVPKLVVKSSYTTFGTDIADNVLKEARRSHPIFRDLAEQGYKDIGEGRFTGDADDREGTKVRFRGNKNDYMNNQGNMWATTVSPAGKEGVDFGNAHFMLHYDQDWNPQKMAQFTARVRRSDSAKTHNQAGRSNSVRVESLHMPGTIEDFMFNAQDTKMRDIKQVTDSTRQAEERPKLGETEGTIGYGHRGFTSRKRPNAKAKNPTTDRTAREVPKSPGAGAPIPKGAVAQAEKALKLVVLL